MSDTYMASIDEKLSILIRLMGVSVARQGDGTQQEAISRLNAAGLAPKDIALILNTTPNSVSVALSKLKKKPIRTKSEK